MTEKRIKIVLETSGAKKNADDLDRSVKSVGKSADVSNLSLKAMAVAISAVIATKQIVEYADAWTKVENQLKRVTSGSQDLQQTTQQLLKVSNDTRTSLQDTAGLYTTLYMATRTLGTSQEKVVEITKTINNLFLESGKSAEESAGAIRQLSQAFEKGKLNGDEFVSVAEGAPGILRAIQKETGLTRDGLSQMAEQGKLSVDLIVKSLSSYSSTAQKAADKTQETFGQSLVVAKNGIVAFIGALDEASKFSSTLASAIDYVGRSLSSPELLNGTKTFVERFTNTLSSGVKQMYSDHKLFFELLKAGFTDATVDQAIQNRIKAYADMQEQLLNSQISSGQVTPQSRHVPKGAPLAKREPVKVAPLSKEQLEEQKKLNKDLLDAQIGVIDDIKKESARQDAAKREIDGAKTVTQQLQSELENRRKISVMYYDLALNDSLGYYDKERKQLEIAQAEKMASIDQEYAREADRVLEQRSRALENKDLEASDKILIESEYNAQIEALKQAHEENKTAIELNGKIARDELAQAEGKQRLDDLGNLGNALMSLGQGQSKKIFKVGQALALAQTAVSLPASVMESFKNGGGYPWGLIPAGAMLATGLKNIQQIKNAGASIGAGGGGITPSASIGSGAIAAQIPASTSSPELVPQQKKIVEFRGNGKMSLFTGEEVAEIIAQSDNAIVIIDSAREDAARRNVIGVTAR